MPVPFLHPPQLIENHKGNNMAAKTEIEWTDETLNPTTGCDKCSPGCKNCYAETKSMRLKAMGLKKYKNGFNLTVHHGIWEKILHWRKRRICFINSMSDLFHKEVPLEFIQKGFKTFSCHSTRNRSFRQV